MKYRTATLLAAQALPLAATRVIDLNVADIISRIMIRWEVGRLTMGMAAEAHRDIIRIELIDGSDVLHSMSGGQNQALCIFDRKCPTMNYGVTMAGNDQCSHYGIDFGRYLWDPELAFDPKRFKNPQLRITYNCQISDNAPVTGTLDVILECFDEKVPSPIGFLMSKEYYNAAPPAAGNRDIDLPVDFPYRRLIVQGFRTQWAPWNVVDRARLDEDNDKRILFDWHLGDYYRFRRGIDTPVVERIVTQAQPGGVIVYCTPTDFWATLVTQGSGPGVQNGIGNSGQGGFFTVLGAGATQIQAIAMGHLPNHCWNFPFGDDQDINDWYDVTSVGHLRLRLHTGAGVGAGTESVVIQQLRRY